MQLSYYKQLIYFKRQLLVRVSESKQCTPKIYLTTMSQISN